MITAMDRLPGSDPGGDVDVLGTELRRPRRGLQPGHPGGLQVPLGQVDGVGGRPGGPNPPGGARPRRRLPDRQGRGGLQAGNAPGRAGGGRLRPQVRGPGQPDGGRGGWRDHEGAEPDAGEGAAPHQGVPRRDQGGGVDGAGSGWSSRDAGVREEAGAGGHRTGVGDAGRAAEEG